MPVGLQKGGKGKRRQAMKSFSKLEGENQDGMKLCWIERGKCLHDTVENDANTRYLQLAFFLQNSQDAQDLQAR